MPLKKAIPEDDLTGLIRSRMEAIRKDRGFTTVEWAHRAGVTRTSVTNFINQHSNDLYFKTAIQLADAAGVSVEAFVSDQPKALPRMIAIPWLQLGQPDLSGAMTVGTSHSNAPMQFSRDWIDHYLLGEPARGRMFEIVGESLVSELNTGDIVCLDIQRVLPEREPGLYCVASEGFPSVRRIAPLLGHRLRFLSDNNHYPEIEVDKKAVQIVGRVVWRSGAL